MLKVLKTILFSLLFNTLTFAVGIKSSLEVGGNMYIKGNLYLKSDKTAPETAVVQITRGNNKPAIRWTSQGWQYTNDGINWNNFGSGGGGGGGDMYKSVYDTNNNGIVDNSESVVDNSITSAKIQDGAITETKIQNNAISTIKLQDNSVSTAKIQNNAITTAKLSDYSVNETKLADNSVSTIKIKNGAITADKLADNSVNSAKIANGAITNEDISSTANISLTKLSPYPFGTNDIQDGAISTSKIQDNAITGTKIQNGVITENHLSSAARILKTNEVLTLPSVSGNSGKYLKTDGTQLLWDIPSGGGDMYKSTYDVNNNGIVDNAESVIDNAISTNKIQNGAVTGIKIATGSITENHLSSTAKILKTNEVLTLPSISGNGGKFLKTDGSSLSWDLPSGGGDMYKSTYDVNNNGVVDNSEKITGLTFPSVSGNAGKFLKTDGSQLLWDTPSGGATTFLQLIDTPSSYNGQAGKMVKVKSDETGLEFDTVNVPGGSDGAVQYNCAGTFAGSSNFTWDPLYSVLNINGALLVYGGSRRDLVIYDGEISCIKGVHYQWPLSQGSPGSVLTNDGYGGLYWGQISGGGDMLKSVYDTDNDGIVDNAESVINNAISTNKIQDGAVTGVKIATGSITENHLSPTAKILKTNEVLTLPSVSGSGGKFLKTDGSTLIWDTPSGGGSPGGSNLTVQYNNNGTFAGDSNFTWDPSLSKLNINGALQIYGSFGNLVLANGQIEYINGVNYQWPGSQGSPGSVLTNDGNGNLFWSQNSCSPGGTVGSIQYNDNGSFGGSPYFYFDPFTTTLVIYGAIEVGGGTFTITPFGDLYVKGVNYTLPDSQGSPWSTLINDGSGYLTWVKAVGGYNQFKDPIQTITVGSSPFVYQQTYYNLASVIVSGGNVSSIEISRDGNSWYNVGLTQGQFTLNLNDYIRVTYTTAPNMYLMEH